MKTFAMIHLFSCFIARYAEKYNSYLRGRSKKIVDSMIPYYIFLGIFLICREYTVNYLKSLISLW